MKAAIKLLLFLAVAYALARLAGHMDVRKWLPGDAGPELAVLSVDCVTHDGLPRAEVLVRNMGDAAIESPTGVLRFGESRQTGYFVPGTIPPQGHASLVVYPYAGSASDCELVSVADKDGRATELARRPRLANPRDRMQVFP